ncbi:MAG TPA: hypothetical protein EYH34_09930 [Planctomycetes bacterium]|nr:hypothetical protein [Planctomycetota bacterium]
MSWQMDPGYEGLIRKARQSHERGRSTAGIDQRDVDLARLYSYAYRTHTIGAFHATRSAIQSRPGAGGPGASPLTRALETLHDLANMGMEPVPKDFRALLSTLYRYDCGVRRVLDALDQKHQSSGDEAIGRIAFRFRRIIEQITTSNGIPLARDTDVPEQASFLVSALGVTIVPLVYGDHHSWNVAQLPAEPLTTTSHRHHHGVEIHLGYGPLDGYTILGAHCARVTEGYAMPIPVRTTHGYINTSGRAHSLPFIFGSLTHAGWGVFFDVEPCPRQLDELQSVPVDSQPMNGTKHLDREITAAEAGEPGRRVIVPPQRTAGNARSDAGALELAVARIDERGLDLTADTFRIVSVVRGSGLLRIAQLQRPVHPHDHFGIPAGLRASLRQRGAGALVTLDSVIRSL